MTVFDSSDPARSEVTTPGEITELLAAWQRGSMAARERLLALCYDELRRIAARRLAGQACELDPTELVHELMLRLLRAAPLAQDRQHFFRIVGLAFRQLLVDHARRALAQRRQGEDPEVSWGVSAAFHAGRPLETWLDIETALQDLESRDPRKARVCELVLLLGLSQPEAARLLDLSLATLERELRFVRAWLAERLQP